MMKRTTLLLTAASCFGLCFGYAHNSFADYNIRPHILIRAVGGTFSTTHTSHIQKQPLSSLKDFAELTLPKNSGSSILPLSENSGSYLSYPLPKNLGRGWGGFHNTTPIQLAAACFVTDTTNCSGNEFSGNNADDEGHGAPSGPGDGDDYDLDNEERCRQEGYTQTSCPEGQEPFNTCPYDSDYFEECVSSCPSNYVTCELPYYGVGEACDGKYASCEKDTERACQELNPGYVDECGTGQQLSNDRCSYDSSYGTCCNTCAGYDNTTIPEGYVQDGEACTGCDGQEHYKVKPNPCDGYMDCGSMGPDTGAATCLSGSTTMYDNCKACPNLGTLTSCPEPFTCTYEECSGLWYKTGCQPGYDWDASSQTCTCDSSYKYTCNRSNEIPNGSSCEGKYQSCKCSDGYEWKDGTCQKEITRAEWGSCNGYAKNCNIGDIVFSDGTCNYLKISGKTPIAVVVYKSADGNCAQAMALNSIGSYGWQSTYDETDIPALPNHLYEENATSDFSSCENTQAIIMYTTYQSIYPAAWAARKHSTEGTEAGDWCLPAAGIMTSIKNNISVIDRSFALIENAEALENSILWSSSETNGGYAWLSCAYCDNGLNGAYSKRDLYDVRPVIEF